MGNIIARLLGVAHPPERAEFRDYGTEFSRLFALCETIRADHRRAYEEVGARITNLEIAANIHRLVAKSDLDELARRAMAVGSLLAPQGVVGFGKRRLGRAGDGGYVMVDDFEGVSHAYSFGIGTEDSWDLEVASSGIPVSQYDHTVASAPTKHENCAFFSNRLASVATENCVTLGELLGDAKPSDKILLKVDIEGDEWQIFEHIRAESLKPVCQIVCEFHALDLVADDRYYPGMRKGLENLAEEFSVVHVHGNNSAPWLHLGGVPLPSVLEITFASRRFYQFEPSDEIFPTPLDRPNYPGSPDYYLGRFAWPKAT